MKRPIFMALSLLAGVANAQTYDVDIVMQMAYEPAPIVLDGSFTYTSGQITNINFIDPGVPTGEPSSVFTVGQVGPGNAVKLIDIEGAPVYNPASSEVWTLQLLTNQPLGGAVDVTGVIFDHGGPQPDECDRGAIGLPPNNVIGCSKMSMRVAPTAAPEIAPSAAALALLFGSLAVMRGRRRDSHSRNGLKDCFVVL
jgi:hypothetical protein